MGFVIMLALIMLAAFVILVYFIVTGIKFKSWKRSILPLLSYLAVLGIVIFFFSWNGYERKLETTDLSNIYLDELTIGMEAQAENFTSYTKSDIYSGDYKYKFEEVVVDTDEHDEISYLFGRFDENLIKIRINDQQVKTIKDVKNVLGNHFQNKNYDREQQLKEYIYKDHDNNIKVEIIYSTVDNKLQWITIKRLGI